MSILKAFTSLYKHLPRDEQLAAAHADLLEAVRNGLVVAVQEGDDVRYLHVEHCSDEQLRQRMSVDEMRRSQEESRRRTGRDWN